MQRFEIRDDAGNWRAEGERDRVREPWTIRYEDGEERFHGSEAQAKAKAARRLMAKTLASARQPR